MLKKESRIRRATRARAKIRQLGRARLCVFRSPRHMYAQVISPDGDKVLASASTVDKELRGQLDGHSGNCKAASLVGELIAKRAKDLGVDEVAFDRSGFRFHGRVKALADAAREHGLQF
jgi:large subunit ribosomal protein L18